MRLHPRNTVRPTVTLLLTAGATAALGGPVRRWLLSNGKLDVPNHRSSHETPVPRGGGIAALLGATTAACATSAQLDTASGLSIAGLAALGWLDDATGHVPMQARLLGQLGVGAIGLSRDLADVPIAAVTTSGVVNVFNFMDGINGISALTAAVWGINAMLLDDESQGELSTIGALAAGAGLGFLPHNLPNSRLFLGDVGSYALGTTIAAGILSQAHHTNRLRVGAPLLLYVADAMQALTVRSLNGRPIGEAHREHVYQRLVDLGRSHTEVAIRHAAFSALAALATRLPRRHQLMAHLALITLYIRQAPKPHREGFNR